ncbi:MAG: SPOR domain-containing protein [Candidatus Sulfotelmatobacter sp.]
MESSQDTEITLGTTKLLGLFFGLVMICAVFFALGYTLGRKSDTGMPASAAIPAQAPASASKPASSTSSPAQPMTFYKAVEQKDANAQLTPATDAVSVPPASPTQSIPAASAAPASSAGAQSASSENTNPPDPMAAIPAAGYFVQIAAVSKQEDAQALVDALKQKQYPAFVAANSSSDNLFRVQMGPFGDIKEAEGMRARLINDGYNPILKK